MALAILSLFLPFVVIETTGIASSSARSDRALELAVEREVTLGKHRCPQGSRAPRCRQPVPSATATASPTPTGSTTTSTPTTKTTLPTTTTTAHPVGGLPPGVTLREVDGGPSYFARWPNTLPSDPSFFPIGVWLQCVAEPGDAAVFANAGINVFNTICTNSDLDLVPENMHVLAQFELNDIPSHPRIDGRLLGDEADMMFGAGHDAWNGTWDWNTCVPPQDRGGQCGYTVMQTKAREAPADNTPRYANYGLGVWEWETDAEASVFINQYTDFVSADVYFFTHPSMESERHGRRYGDLIDRMRYLDGLDGERQPVWATIEVGHPFSEDSAPTITPAQIRSAVWHSIIAGARGITYFNHSFGGTDACRSWNVIQTCADVRAMVTSIDGQIRDLAPVLNGPSADGYVSTSSGVGAMSKLGPDGAWYVFAGSTNTGGTATFTVAAGSSVEVLYEGRNLSVHGNQFTDSFTNANTIHIYRITS